MTSVRQDPPFSESQRWKALCEAAYRHADAEAEARQALRGQEHIRRQVDGRPAAPAAPPIDSGTGAARRASSAARKRQAAESQAAAKPAGPRVTKSCKGCARRAPKAPATSAEATPGDKPRRPSGAVTATQVAIWRRARDAFFRGLAYDPCDLPPILALFCPYAYRRGDSPRSDNPLEADGHPLNFPLLRHLPAQDA